MMVSLTTTFTPTNPSNLRNTSPPHSPLSPLSPSRSSTLSNTPSLPPPPIPTSPTSSIKMTDAPPTNPPPWSWSCHLCHSQFPLGATRRCLHDGHFFCAGTTTDQRSGKTRKHRACGSVFDYVGWQKWGEWRRATSDNDDGWEDEKENISPTTPTPKTAYAVSIPKSKNCELDCDFPSECRWRPKIKKQRKRATVVQPTSAPAATTLLAMPASAEAASEPALTSAIIQDFAAFKAEMDTAVLAQPPPRSTSVVSSTSGPLPSVFEFDDDDDEEDDDDEDDAMEVETSPPHALSIADMQQLDPPPHSMDVEPGIVTALVLEKGVLGGKDEEVVSPRRGAWDWSVGGEGLGGWNGLLGVEVEKGVVAGGSRDVEMVL